MTLNGPHHHDQPEAAIRYRDVARLYESPPVRVLLNRAELTRLDPPVDVRCLPADTATLEGLYPPWYVDPAGNPAEFRDDGARPVSFAEIGRGEARVSTQHLRHAQALREEVVSTRPYLLTLPGYRVSGGATIVLDGNHRLLAGVLDGADLTLVVFGLRGPIDSRFLPDLGRWADE